ncbi:MAG: hypothetical protein QME32_05870 [Endomicrobiia bacterium]|nr:hypothetical protein [Endomicrobiia bacterium]
MRYLVERDLFMSKIDSFINEKCREGYKLVSVFVTETEEKMTGDGKKLIAANKATLVLEKME